MASEVKLTLKQRDFVEAYIGAARGNASEAARIAGYKAPGQQGYENLKKPEIRAEIEAQLSLRTLSANEVLAGLTEHSKASLKPFLYMQGDVAVIDLSTEEAESKLHLLKKVKTKRRSGGKPEDRWEEVETEIELHDPQSALVQLGRYHKLFTDKAELTGKDGEAIKVHYEQLRDLPPDELVRIHRETLGD
jgi:phage terminase small subunit